MSLKTSPMRVALVGLGSIGKVLLELLKDEPGLRFDAIVVQQGEEAFARDFTAQLAPFAQIVNTVPSNIDLVVEAAGHTAIREHVLPQLKLGTPCIVASVGALSLPGLAEQLEAAARDGRAQVQLIAGAIGAIDALTAARQGGLNLVIYTGSKPVRAWMGTPAEQCFKLDLLTEATVIFEGSAREAASMYPKNANVAATVSLAGVGLDDTRVKLIADPQATENTHKVEAKGSFGSFEFVIRNKALVTNPKTSVLTVYSLARAIRNRIASISI